MKKRTVYAMLAIAAMSSVASAGVIYTQNFDSMGTSGLTFPAGWTEYGLGTSHDTFSFAGSSTSIAVTHLPSDTPTAINVGPTGGLTLTQHTALAFAANDPSGTTYRSASASNFGTASSPSDRCLGTSPTGTAANELQLTLTNTTGADISALSVSYDIRRFSTTTANNSGYTGDNVGLEELPGYWLFYSLDNGANWTNVSALNPTKTGPDGVIVPNTIGVTNVPATEVDLAGPWTANGNLLLRWVDDNAQSPSPDQYIGLDNVVISTVATPEPASLSVLALAGFGLLGRRRRKT